MAHSATALTSAKFKMLVNSDPYSRKYQCLIEDNAKKEQYSYLDSIIQIYRISFGDICENFVIAFLKNRNELRRNYFRENYSRLIKLPSVENDESYNIKIELYNIKIPVKSLRTVDQILNWFPVINNSNSSTRGHCQIEFTNFKRLLLEHSLLLLEEYYIIVDNFPHLLLLETLEFINKKANEIDQIGFNNMNRIHLRCLSCGFGCKNSKILENHKISNQCNKSQIHRCLCNMTFTSHTNWIHHWLKSNMACPVTAWLLWRNLATLEYQLIQTPNNVLNKINFNCNGCSTSFCNYLKFWNHICHCPFFRLYLLVNCTKCNDEENRIDEQYNDIRFQKLISTPHSDKVGIKILKEWAEMENLSFRIKLSSPSSSSSSFLDDISAKLSLN